MTRWRPSSGTDAAGLDRLARNCATIYPIASRCGVFAKTDILPLLNEGCAREDIAASIMQAVVNQTIGGLARGRAIKGKVVFLGGPLFFLHSLRERFTAMLKDMTEAVFPDDGHFFVALGAAYHALNMAPREMSFQDCLTVLEKRSAPQTYGRLPPLVRLRGGAKGLYGAACRKPGDAAGSGKRRGRRLAGF